MAGKLHVFVGTVVHRVEHHGQNARAVHVERHGFGQSGVKLLGEVNEPLSLFRSEKKSSIFGMVCAGGDVGMQFAVPREHRFAKKKAYATVLLEDSGQSGKDASE